MYHRRQPSKPPNWLDRLWNRNEHGKPVANNIDEVTETAPPGVITVKELDLCLKMNGKGHYTSRYDLMRREENSHLVVRRGQPFSIKIVTNRAYNAKTDGISFVFTVQDAEKPSFGQGTLGIAVLQTKNKSNEKNLEWYAYLEESTGNKMKVRIYTPVNSIVSRWNIDIDTKLQTGGAVSYPWLALIYILYNPWCPQDQVYLESEEQRQEYVLEDTGLIWRGTANRIRAAPWVYAQFERDVLDCALYSMTQVGNCHGKARADPVKVSRALSAAINALDNNGVVCGKWGSDFGSHTPPTKWIGSMKILQQYYKRKKSVKYGQCWVFSGVLTTICRAIGIPVRPVTNYNSGHDTDGSMTLDIYVDETGKKLEDMGGDSHWNFHVWNEVWMDRPDLGSEYNGWQVIDSTPQELSNEMYRCGPAPILAVKKGEILRPYDCGFVYSEVNADILYWKYSGPAQPLKLLSKDIHTIGYAISTKAVGKMEREDITNNYKYPEESIEERETMLKALQQSENKLSRFYLNEDFNDINFDFELRDDIKIGQPFSVVLAMQNRSNTKKYKVNVILRVEAAQYTGKIIDLVKQNETEIVVKPGKRQKVRMEVTYNEYYKKLRDQCCFNISCFANVLRTKYEYFAQDDFRVRKPDIRIKLKKNPENPNECITYLSLENPLPIPLRKGQFFVESPGITKHHVIKVKETIPPSGIAKAEVIFIPPTTGSHTLAAKFVSKDLDDIDGFVSFMVQSLK